MNLPPLAIEPLSKAAFAPFGTVIERDGADIFCEVPISFSQATLGTDLEVPTLEGQARLKIPAGTQTHKIFRLKKRFLIVVINTIVEYRIFFFNNLSVIFNRI